MMSETVGKTNNNDRIPAELSKHHMLNMIKGMKVDDQCDNDINEDFINIEK